MAIPHPYKYEDLKEDSSAIRILKLYPDEETRPLRGSLDIIEEDQEYEALSWTWGDEEDLCSIQIVDANDDSSKGFLSIKPNLASALKQLRHPSRYYRHLWIDAVCIQQGHEDEKNRQVEMMAKIYSEAKNVRVWLGEEKESSASAMNFIRDKVVKLGGFDRLVNKEDVPEEWGSLVALMNRDWFSRRQATLHCGKDSVEWTEFAAAVALFERRSARIAKQFQRSQDYEYNPNYIGDIQAMGASRLVLTTTNLYRKSDEGRIIDRRLSLEALVSILSDFKARERHDTFYAALPFSVPIPRVTPGKDHDGVTLSEPFDVRKDGPVPNRGELEDCSGEEPSSKGECARKEGTGKRSREGSPEQPEKKRNKTHEIHNLDNNRTLEDTHEAVRGQQEVVMGDGHARSPATTSTAIPEVQKALLRKLKVPAKFKNTIQPGNTRRLKVNYKLPFPEVCKEFLIFAIAKSESLDILCRPWAPEEAGPDEKAGPLPSWIPTLAGTPFGMVLDDYAPGGRRMTRQNADPLVGLYSHGKKVYAAYKSVPAIYNVDWGFRDTESRRIMFVTGFVLDTVDEALAPAFFGNIPGQWIKMGWPDKTRPTPERFWRTLVADRGPDGDNVPVYYGLAWDYACNPSTQKVGVWSGLVNRGIDTADRIHHCQCTIMAEYLRRVQSVIWNKRLIRTKMGDYLGLGPEKTEKGDLICILRGCSVPVILRQTAAAKADAKPVYTLIGEAYVHGKMDGEAIDLQVDNRIPIEMFELE
ncbi:hypothetical protein H2199_001226 [Coniosporium tulheliwenetii]|uniref:Uncharacterized protein n=1 Tax=Coniosporium tulheliwenetii TaxID=3383036 RepID=A0ACC2ZLG5_9PEZI|nr:hypothetical protein H2199_001226 [Cladosporium sp. JES 115]